MRYKDIIYPAVTLALGALTNTLAADFREAPRIVPAADSKVGRLVEDLQFAPVAGKKFRLSDWKSAKAVVVAFTSTSCPVTKRYAPTLAGLEKEFSAREVKFIFVNPLAADSVGPKLFGGPYVHDRKGDIAAALGAQTTAEVFVLDAARTLIYRGAIDDQYGVGYSRDSARHHYLKRALEAVLGGGELEIAATTAPGCALDLPKRKTSTEGVTYHARVSRIMQQHCMDCHRADGVGPFSLEAYQDVVSHAGMIRKQVEKGAMPPWFAAPEHPSRWANDRRLPEGDKADLLAWLAGGRQEGNRADAPLPRKFALEWQIGEPDAVVRLPETIAVNATGTMPYQLVFVETTFEEDRWVQAVEVRPTARQVVHHALIHVVPKEKAAQARERRRGGESNGDGFFAVYVPGNNVLQFPDGFGKLLPAGATLRFQIHYTPNGEATSDQTAVGLKFCKVKPPHEIRVSAVAARLDIPPGEPNYQVQGILPVPFDAKLISFMPHMHVRGKAYKYELRLPNGETKPLLDVPQYDFNWQLQYKLADFVDAPAGSQLIGTARYDNSTNNPANPDPTQRVRWGEQTYEEMMLGYVEYYVPGAVGTSGSIAEAALRDGSIVFLALDKNRDGKITLDETPSPKDFKDADADADGNVTPDEFREYWKRRTARLLRDR